MTNGLLGLASPLLTSVYPGTDPAEDNFGGNQIVYNVSPAFDRRMQANLGYFPLNGMRSSINCNPVSQPFFYTAVAENLIAPTFSIALNRPTLAQENSASKLEPFGYFALGGVPSEVSLTGRTVTVPDLAQSVQVGGETLSGPSYYT